jgi:hypothetical protein
MGLLINTSIFIELDSESSIQTSFKDVEEQVAQNSGFLLDRTTTKYFGDSYTRVSSEYESSLRNYFKIKQSQVASQGPGLSLEIKEINEGVTLGQDTRRNFTDTEGAKNWTVVKSSDKFRNFTITAQNSSLQNGFSIDDSSTPDDFNQSNIFRVQLEDNTSNVWNIYVYEKTPQDDVYVRVKYPDGTVSKECTTQTQDGLGKIQVANAVVGDTHCESLRIYNNMTGDIDIRYKEGESISGTYNVTTSQRKSEIDTTGFSDIPYAERTVYSSDIQLTYIENGFAVVKNITVQPGDSDNDYYD